jgi:hypothetical protein
MFSQLGPLFRTTFRQAESNDTRLAIPHDEREKRRRKEEDEKRKEESRDLWEDNTSVTVPALRAFLINFLKTLPGYNDAANVGRPPDELSRRPRERTRPTNTRQAKAVRAYQSMAEKTRAENPAGHKPIPPGENKTPENLPAEEDNTQGENIEPTADLLESQELRDIHQLIADLEVLEQNGVENLSIQKADTFIDSMKNAVRLAKSKIS